MGSFTIYYRRGSTGVSAQFYTNDIDAREEQPETEDVFTYNGESRGYRQRIFTVDHWANPPANFGAGDKLWCRLKLFYKTRTDRYDKTRQSAAAVVVPAWFRESMLVARNEFDYQRDGYDHWNWQGVVDPNYGLEYVGDGDNKVDVLSYSGKDAVDELYALTKPFADEGQWCNVGDEVIFDGGMPSSTEGESTPIPGYSIRRLTVTMISNNDNFQKLVKTETRTGDGASLWTPKWFVPSPHPDFGDTQYFDATANSYGDGTALIHMTDIDMGPRITTGMPSDSAFEDRLPVFVGVVNG